MVKGQVSLNLGCNQKCRDLGPEIGYVVITSGRFHYKTIDSVCKVQWAKRILFFPVCSGRNDKLWSARFNIPDIRASS